MIHLDLERVLAQNLRSKCQEYESTTEKERLGEETERRAGLTVVVVKVRLTANQQLWYKRPINWVHGGPNIR